MDLDLIGSFINERFTTRKSVEEAAEAIDVSIATMYRYKSNPEAISLGQVCKLAQRFGLPLANGAVWTQDCILGSERRRLELEAVLAKNAGLRLITLPAYTVNDELPEITRLLLLEDYGSEASKIEAEVLGIRSERKRFYQEGNYESWEIWNGYGYLDFLHGRGRYRSITEDLRQAQIEVFVDSTKKPNVHRFVYLTHSPDLPMFGCHTPPGTALVRVEDIHLEFQLRPLVTSFEETFEKLRRTAEPWTDEQFIKFVREGLDQ